MRSCVFTVGFSWVSILYILMAALLALTPGRADFHWAVKRYSLRMVKLMNLIGIQPEVRARTSAAAAFHRRAKAFELW